MGSLLLSQIPLQAFGWKRGVGTCISSPKQSILKPILLRLRSSPFVSGTASYFYSYDTLILLSSRNSLSLHALVDCAAEGPLFDSTTHPRPYLHPFSYAHVRMLTVEKTLARHWPSLAAMSAISVALGSEGGGKTTPIFGHGNLTRCFTEGPITSSGTEQSLACWLMKQPIQTTHDLCELGLILAHDVRVTLMSQCTRF